MARGDGEPQPGDDVVSLCLEVDGEPLDTVLLSMSHTFVQALRGNKLRKVLTWDPRQAKVQFAVEGKYDAPVRHLRVSTSITEWPDMAVPTGGSYA